MVKIIIALSALYIIVPLLAFFAIRRQVKHYCEYNELDFKRYWHDFIRGKTRIKDADNPYELQRYKKKKQSKQN